MQADQIIAVCNKALLEGPETPEAAIRAVQRMALTITIQELRSKGEGYLRLADRIEGELSRLEDETRQAIEEDEQRF